MRTGYRRIVAVLFVLGAAVCGFAVGAWLGARYFVPPGSGLAGPAIVIGYGVFGAGAGVLAALVACWRLADRAFQFVAFPILIAGIVLGGLATYAVQRAGDAQDAYLASQRASLPVFDVSLADTGSAALPFVRFDYDGDAHAFRVTHDDGTACGGTLSPTSEEKLTLLVALRRVEELLAREADPCAGEGPASARLDFTIREHKPPDTRGDVDITERCRSRHDALADAIASIESVYGGLRSSCR